LITCNIVTSDRSVSLQRVAFEIKDVLIKYGVRVRRIILSPNANPYLYRDVDGAIVVMTFDPAWVIPYLLIARELRVQGKFGLFYTTVEGRVLRTHADEWIYRDLTFIANSQYTKSKIEEAGGVVDMVIYHGVNVKKIQEQGWVRKHIRRRLDLNEDDFVVGYVAAGYIRKGHKLFADVIKRVREKDRSIKFVVLTDKKGAEYYQDVEDVILIPEFGKLTEEFIYGLYHSIDLYAHAALAEGFGLPVLEALAAGVPVVHANYKPLTEITSDLTSFRVPTMEINYVREMGAIEYELHIYDPSDFADTILYAKDLILKDREEYRARCIRRAKAFDSSKMYKTFTDLMYKTVM